MVGCATIQPNSCSKEVLDGHSRRSLQAVIVQETHHTCNCRRGTDPGSAGRALSEAGPGQQRTGKPMKLGSNKFDIPTVR